MLSLLTALNRIWAVRRWQQRRLDAPDHLAAAPRISVLWTPPSSLGGGYVTAVIFLAKSIVIEYVIV
jgi:hypothetical protein